MLENLVALYGAVVATVVGVVQIVQWRSSRKFVVVNWLESFGSDGKSQIEISIKNRAQFPVHLDYVAAGYCHRLRSRPWHVDCAALMSMSAIQNHRAEDEYLSGVVDGTTLQPGQMIYAAISADDIIRQRQLEKNKVSFLIRPCIWIEHSQSDMPVRKIIQMDQ